MVTEITKSNFENETKGSKPTLVDFWAPWCGPCRMQGPIVEKLSQNIGDQANVGKCNVDEEHDLASNYGIMSIPTLIIFKDGQEVERMVGLQQGEDLSEKLRKLAGDS
jgi:thioredoxin